MNEWIDIYDRLPGEDEDVLVHPSSDRYFVAHVKSRSIGYDWVDYTGCIINGVVEWKLI